MPKKPRVPKKIPKNKSATAKASSDVQRAATPQTPPTWQGALTRIGKRVVKISTPDGHGTGFHIGNFGTNDDLCAIATAYHVVNEIHEWGGSVKITHENTKETILLKESDRAIFTYPEKDLAVLLFSKPASFEFPVEDVELIPSGNNLRAGVDIAWCGYPGLMSSHLCFFHGYVSCHLKGDYLIDGVAINGVSGGPVFYISNQTNTVKIAGVITAYVPNRRAGDTLPGVSMITSIGPCEETITHLKSLKQAKDKAAELKKVEGEKT